MQTYHALVADGASYTHENGGGFVGVNRFMEADAENRVQAFLRLYEILAEDHSDITAFKPPGERYMLGFTAEEWEEVARQPIRLRVSEMSDGDTQIQLLQDRPIR
jgi:hypothetical protein